MWRDVYRHGCYLGIRREPFQMPVARAACLDGLYSCAALVFIHAGLRGVDRVDPPASH
ncbi:hypothetical protein [Paracoccus sp. (in: a-proteobacteria)]|uniref:hypothetical protein n=1 Tax=Paracoccus sp. TaxID=267 RepID=UPI0026E08E34|nr:hypothetical protein [Paracoccus sp. (in: a-proteobacteria)]MDO5647540.1 hypothetical protein [Paracoccus sp. (in: a-proteobacteria)]